MIDSNQFLVPHSITKEKWASLDRYFTKIFTRDFCHDDHFTFKVNSRTTQAASFKFRDRLSWRDDKLNSASDLRFWFPVDENTLYARLYENGVKLHADYGVTKLGGNKFNTYSTIYFNRKGQDKRFAFGCQNLSENWHSDTRIQIDEYKSIDVGSRTHIRHGPWNIASMSVFKVLELSTVARELYVGYLEKKWQVHVRADKKQPKPDDSWKDIRTWFNKLTFIGLYKRNSQERYGLQVDFNPSTKSVGDITGVFEYQHNVNNGLKVKMNDKMNLSFVLKHIASDQLSVSLGASLPFGSTLKQTSKVGIQCSLNI